MNAKRLTGKLRRLARQEVPDKPDLWPAIQARLSRQHTATARGTTHRAEVASVFTWRADARRSRFGTGALTLASALVLVLLVAGLALILGNQSGDHPAVGSGATPSPSLAAMATPSSTDPTAEAIPSTCPVTLPPPTFVPATPAPGAAGSLTYFTYGTNDLWTKLPVTGNWAGLPLEPGQGYVQKIFWVSANDQGPQMPDLTVTGRRLDAPAPPLLVSPSTNADAPGLGPSMLVGVNFPTLGCWKISGTYKGHTLSFVIWVSQHPVPTPAPTPVVPPTPLACTKESDATFLQHVIDAFNRGDQTTLARSFPDDSVSSNVSVPRFSFNQQNGAGFSTDRPSEMLTNFAQRHTQHEVWQLGNVNVGGGGGNVSMTITSDSTPLRTLFGKISFDCPHSWITFWHMTDTAGIAPQLPFVPVMLPDSLPLTNVSDQFTVDDLGGSCDPNAGLQPLTRFIDAFNQGDQQKLATFFSPVPGHSSCCRRRPTAPTHWSRPTAWWSSCRCWCATPDCHCHRSYSRWWSR